MLIVPTKVVVEYLAEDHLGDITLLEQFTYYKPVIEIVT